MTVMESDNAANEEAFGAPWQHLRVVDALTSALSRGFLRCRPEKWFPGFAAHWLPLSHSLGLEVRVAEIKPALRAVKGLERGFYGVVDKERVALYMDGESERVILAAVAPGANRQASSIALEYLARRFFSSLASAWSGAETTNVQFMREVETHAFTETAVVKFSILINNNPCHLSVLLGESLVKRLDGLWRRQVQSSHRFAEDLCTVRVELMQQSVSQSYLKETVVSGNEITLDQDAPEYVTLLMNGKSWLPGRLCLVDERLAIETIAAPLSTLPSGDGNVKLRLELGALELDASLAAEISQVGAILETPLTPQTKVGIFANETKVAEGQLKSSAGRVVVSIF